MAQVDRVFLNDRDFPLSLRILFSGVLIVLGIGYLFAMIYVYVSHSNRDGQPGLSVTDLAIAYSGSKEDTKLEAALKGPMSGMLSPGETGVISAWIRRGAIDKEYEAEVKEIVEIRCLACHDGSNPHIADLSSYDAVVKLAELDTGTDIFTLIRVSHIHMFGISFIFFIVGFMFSYAAVQPIWLKSAAIGFPFLAIIMDVSSWYLTKLFTPFAWMVLIGGAIMGLCFASMWVVTMYQLWLSRYMQKRRQAKAAT